MPYVLANLPRSDPEIARRSRTCDGVNQPLGHTPLEPCPNAVRNPLYTLSSVFYGQQLLEIPEPLGTKGGGCLASEILHQLSKAVIEGRCLEAIFVLAFRPIYETILELLDRKALVVLLVGAGGSVCP